MYATVQKWGNSHGLRIPKQMLETMNLQENDKVLLAQEGDTIVIRKASRSKHKTLAERLVSFYGRPIENVPCIETQEIDTGTAVGEEVW